MADNLPHPDDVIDVRTAAEVLGVTEDRVPVMVEEGLLTPVEGSTDRFQAAEVLAVRVQGG
jgi:hypothetical protein